MNELTNTQSHYLFKKQLDSIDLKEKFEEGFCIINLNQVEFTPLMSSFFHLKHFSLLFVKKGNGICYKEGCIYNLAPYTINFSNIYRYRNFTYKNLQEVFFICFSEYFLKRYVNENIYKEFKFLLTERMYPVDASKSDFIIFENIYKKIYSEFNNGEVESKYKIIGNLMAILLYYFKDLYIDCNINKDVTISKTSTIVISFKKLMDSHYNDLKEGRVNKVFRVQDYARQLDLHPNYLSRIIKNKTGKSAALWITEKAITESKLLLTKDFSIKEIVHLLGFFDTSHFNKFFKKHTHLTPTQYKQNNLL
ncbi:helix-turn-helix domain-containing protein [Chryseobacterium sp. Chry.R1]|uniref:helix-turn-helix domain-containing protein n=1 Tax=Chryseobacterium sp. Chry.R1 TaxID=3139392 RepID=UPI0031F7398D